MVQAGTGKPTLPRPFRTGPAASLLRARVLAPRCNGRQGLKGFSYSYLKPRGVKMSEVRLIDNAACSHALHVQVEHLVLLFDGEPYAFIAST